MAGAKGNVTGLNLATFIKDTETTLATPGKPTTTELGTKTGSEAATKLVAKANFMPDITNLGAIGTTANEAEYLPFFATQSKQIPGIPSQNNWSFTFAAVYPGGTETQAKANIFGKLMSKAPGDYLEIAVVKATGDLKAAQAVTGLTRGDLSLMFFKGKITSTNEFPGGAAQEASFTIDMSLSAPAYRIWDAES